MPEFSTDELDLLIKDARIAVRSGGEEKLRLRGVAELVSIDMAQEFNEDVVSNGHRYLRALAEKLYDSIYGSTNALAAFDDDPHSFGFC